MSWSLKYVSDRERGFALPTILIASIVMMMVLLSAVQTAVSVRTALDNQYYNKVAQTAAESGTAYALGCIKEAGTGEAPWGNGTTLTANMDCFGDTIPSASSYILDTPSVKSTFFIRVSDVNSSGLPLSLSVQGRVSLHRQSNNQEWRSVESSLGVKLDRNSIVIGDLASGVTATCAAVGGKAYCWGDQSDGRLGNGQTSGIQRKPQPVIEEAGVLEGRRVTQISVGHGSVCALAVLQGNTAGRVFCWGDNTQGQLGINSSVTSSSRPVAVRTAAGSAPTSYLPDGETITKITTGRGYACAVTTGERLYCWGNNSSGQLGLNSLTTYRYPRLITSTLTSGVKDVFAGSGTKTTCAIRTLSGVDRLYCWGNNRQGQVGVGATSAPQAVPVSPTHHAIPQLVAGNFGIASGAVINASVGGYSGAADVGADGAVASDDALERGFVCGVGAGKRGYCWGSTIRGSTGHSDATSQGQDLALTIQQPLFASSFSGHENYIAGNIEKIVTGWGTACALRTTTSADPYSSSPTNKALLCWGTNELSNLGMNDASLPKTGVANLWLDVNAPPATNTCSGAPEYARCMLILRIPRHMPAFQPSSPLHTAGISELYGGGHRMCVVSGGQLYCWGNNSAGQVGNSQTTASPIAWPTLADLVENLKDVYLY